MQYTPEQSAVLNARGKIIVSASAGSGKTFIMIERILQAILSGADISRMLAVTFTNKAAAQMREKIQKTLINRINEENLDEAAKENLKIQLNNLPMSEISTIHAFCSRFIRSYFFLAGVDSSFEIISDDDADGKQLQAEALEAVFTQAYEEKNEDFSDLLSVYYRSKNDNRLKEMVLQCYKTLRSRADYRETLRRIAEGEDLFDLVCRDLLAKTQRECAHLLTRTEDLESDLLALGRGKKTLEQTGLIKEFLKEALQKQDYFEFCAMPPVDFPKKESVRGGKDPELKVLIDEFTACRDAVNKLFKSHLSGAVSSRETEKYRLDMAQKTAGQLAGLILKFDERYSELKAEQAKLDYNDLEHFALKLLENETVAEEMRGKFDYVFVDEYQDVNPVQEKILSRISGENVFLVGDVKQSIYAFRGGKSRYFTEKCAQFQTEGNSLNLTSNFRSGRAVLDGVNRVFTQAMTRETSDIDYALTPMFGGDGYGERDGHVRVHYLEEEEKEKVTRGVYSVLEEYEAVRKKREESRLGQEVLNIIEEELGGEYFDLEEGQMKPMSYGDIAVLARNRDSAVSEVIAYLSENGIPVSTATKINLCAYAEIAQLTDILSLLDNREQDIPLCSALLSEMGGISNDDLATIRIRYENNRKPFRECVRMYADQFDDEIARKLKVFFARLGKYVALSVTLTAGELTERLIAECGQEAKWLSMEGGNRRVARVRSFILQMGDKNVHEFLQYLRELEYNVPVAENEGENAVKVMTVHASKGLEYPVVILIDLDKSFHGAERSEALISEKYGIATRFYDRGNKLVYSTLLRKLIAVEEREEELKGELNLLYVAMTRAKYGLHLVLKAKKSGAAEDPFYATSYADLLPAKLFVNEVSPAYPPLAPFEKRQALVSSVDESVKEKILRVISVPYAYAADTQLPVKTSASGLMKEKDVGEYYKAYDFLSTEEETAEKRDIGTAYHAFLQYADFGADGEEEFYRLCKKGLLSEEQIKLLSPEKTKQILGMSVFKRLCRDELYREQPFMAALPAKEMFGETDSERSILFQGFIDLLAIGKNGVEIVDYKYSSRSADGIREHYATQIKLYKKAVAKIMKIREDSIRTTIVNIQSGEEIPM